MCYTNKVCQDLSVKRKEVILLKKTKDEIRRDSKGRRLQDNELQRPNGSYEYRYRDLDNKRHSVYAPTLDELREKKKEINLQLAQGINYVDGKVILSEIVDKYFSLKKNKWRKSTLGTMEGHRKILSTSRLYNMPINKIKIIDCKEYIAELSEDYSYSVVQKIYSLLKDCFNLACESDAISKNPCTFKLRSIVENDSEKIPALTEKQENSLLDFLRNDICGRKYIEIFIILLGTGLRISEFAALTTKDIDFKENVIHVNKQITRTTGAINITAPKTKAAYRDIHMTDDVRDAICSLVEKQKSAKVNAMIDGYVGFLSVSRSGKPRTHSEYSDLFLRLLARYNKQSEIKIERCTPHSLRHTFATKCVASGMDIKSATYIMGHSDATVLLNIYADVVKNNLAASMKLIKIG